MDVLASAEFRKTYARLTKPTKVTVNGHVIGTWTPGGLLSYDDIPDIIEGTFRRDLRERGVDIPPPPQSPRYDIRPIRPVPKKR